MNKETPNSNQRPPEGFIREIHHWKEPNADGNYPYSDTPIGFRTPDDQPTFRDFKETAIDDDYLTSPKPESQNKEDEGMSRRALLLSGAAIAAATAVGAGLSRLPRYSKPSGSEATPEPTESASGSSWERTVVDGEYTWSIIASHYPNADNGTIDYIVHNCVTVERHEDGSIDNNIALLRPGDKLIVNYQAPEHTAPEPDKESANE